MQPRAGIRCGVVWLLLVVLWWCVTVPLARLTLGLFASPHTPCVVSLLAPRLAIHIGLSLRAQLPAAPFVCDRSVS